jgi:transcriptional regulator with XRE-family HTH domain
MVLLLFLQKLVFKMEFYERIKQKCSEAGITATAMCKSLEIPTSHMGKWKAGGKPGADIVVRIAQHLGCSVEYLVLGTDIPHPPAPAGLSEKERLLLDAYHARPEFQPAVDALLGLAGGTVATP